MFFGEWSRRRVLVVLGRILFFQVLLLLLVGCVRLAIDPSPQELMGFQEDVLAAYDEAARLYDWFDLAPMPLDESDSVREGENTYFRVLDETITSTKELRSRLERVFTSELAEEIFNKVPDQYQDFDGKLYAIPGGRGTNIYLLDKTVQAGCPNQNEAAMTDCAFFQSRLPYEKAGGEFFWSA